MTKPSVLQSRCMWDKKINWDGRYLELDTFLEPPLPHHLLEIEQVSMDDEISFPPFLKVVKEVTDDPEWYNMNIAKI